MAQLQCSIVGYAISSGRYFKDRQIYYAVGAPRTDLTGKVCFNNTHKTDRHILREYIYFKSSYLHEIFLYKQKHVFLSRRLIPLATLLYEQFILLT